MVNMIPFPRTCGYMPGTPQSGSPAARRAQSRPHLQQLYHPGGHDYPLFAKVSDVCQEIDPALSKECLFCSTYRSSWESRCKREWVAPLYWGSAGPPCLAGLSWDAAWLLTRAKSSGLQTAGLPPMASGGCGAGGGEQSCGQHDHDPAAAGVGQHTFVGVG